MTLSLLIASLLALVLLSGFFSLAQIALFSLSTSEVQLEKNRRIQTLLARPRELLVTLLFCDIGANLFIQNTAAKLSGPLSSWTLKVAFPLCLTLLFGEVIPKTIALAFNARIACAVAPIISWIQYLLGPLRDGLTALTTRISHTLFFFLRRDPPLSDQEIRYVLETSEKNGLLNHDEAQLTQGFMSLTHHTIKERMHPRLEIIAFDIDSPREELAALFIKKGCSRIPVYQGELQNLLGICEARDFFIQKREEPIHAILRKPLYVPETLLARTLLRQFLQKKETFAVVVDEYGSISGIVTKEDLMEMVVGEISDSRDAKPLYTQSSKETVISSGRWEIAQFEKIFGTPLPTANNMATIGGWLTEQMGEIPKTGSRYEWKSFLFQILASSPNRVRTVYIKRLKHE